MDKTILLATFVSPKKVDWFLQHLEVTHNITKKKVFCYKNLDDENNLIFTFKLTYPSDKKIEIKRLFPNGIIIHKKGNALYTINALNKLIDSTGIKPIDGNYKSVKVDWSDYQNKLILTNRGELMFLNINRVF
jgi:hypothetical protein